METTGGGEECPIELDLPEEIALSLVPASQMKGIINYNKHPQRKVKGTLYNLSLLVYYMEKHYCSCYVKTFYFFLCIYRFIRQGKSESCERKKKPKCSCWVASAIGER